MGGEVLVVDDDRDVREAIQMILDAYGMTVRVASDPQQALDWLAAKARPSVILLDMRMPEMSGEEFLAGMERMGLRGLVPVVVLSGDTTARHAAQAAGADDFLAKPVDVQVLLATLGRFVAAGASLTD